jgi:hypothetical protein
MPLAFRMTESMSGLHHFVDPARGAPDERPWSFRLTWGSAIGAAGMAALTGKPIVNPFTGTVTVDGLTRGAAPCDGSLTLDYRAGKLTYELAFEVDGARYALTAEKRDVDLLSPMQLAKTHTTAYASIRDADGKIISRGVLNFLPETTGAFMRSFRLTMAS